MTIVREYLTVFPGELGVICPVGLKKRWLCTFRYSPCLNPLAEAGACVQPSSGKDAPRRSPPPLLGHFSGDFSASHSRKPSQRPEPWGNPVFSLLDKRSRPGTPQRSQFRVAVPLLPLLPPPPPPPPPQAREPRSQWERRETLGCRVPSPGPAPLCCGGQWTHAEHRRLPG